MLTATLLVGTAKSPLGPFVTSNPPLTSFLPAGHAALASPTCADAARHRSAAVMSVTEWLALRQ